MDEKGLVKRINHGDKEAFRALVDAYKGLVAHIVFRMVPSRAESEDLCQDVFVKVYTSLPSFRFQSKLSAWIGRITYNTCLNYLGKKKPVLAGGGNSEESFWDSIPGDFPQPDHDYAAKNVSGILHREIEGMPVKYRIVLTLYHLEEMSYQEITEITGLPEGTVKSHLFRGRKYLKDKLIKKYGQESYGFGTF